ncbi:MAG: zinc ribbon domain-containing protein [Bacteroidales bacterium]|nr:zinc ribbon domain-containing protein [Bacteroidales bacterium]
MILCINCGVELDDGFKICPLCGKDPGRKDEPEHIVSNFPSDIIQLQKKENRRYLWELSGIIAFSGIAVCTILNLLISKGLKWSLLSDVSILTAWVILTLYQFAYKKPLLMVTSLILTTLLALFFIDLITTGREWFFPVGLPVAICAYISAGIIYVLYKIAHLHGLNILASAFIVLSGFCILTEMILDEFLDGSADIQWSLFVAVSVLPVAMIFFFYHYRLKKGNQLDSFFHI